MPVLTGINMAKKMRSIRPEIPIILATGYSDSISLKDAKQLNIGFLTKPVVINDLASMLLAKLPNS